MENKLVAFVIGLLAVALIVYGVLLKSAGAGEYIQLVDQEEPEETEAAAPVAAATMDWQAEETPAQQPEPQVVGAGRVARMRAHSRAAMRAV